MLRTPIQIGLNIQTVGCHPTLRRGPAHQWLREPIISSAANV